MSNKNSVVSEIELYMTFLLSRSEGPSSSNATQLVTWIEQSSSLQNVTLRARYRFEGLDVNLLQQVINAMKMNPNIRVFHSHIFNYPLPLMTGYLLTKNAASGLQSLKIELNSPVIHNLDQAAQAIAAMSGLKELSLACSIQFLKRLPVHSTRLLRGLDVDFPHLPGEASDMAIFSSVVSSSKQLQYLSINGAILHSEGWDLIRSGLQSNPSITHLKIKMCRVEPDTRSLIVNHMRLSDMASHQHVRNLELDQNEIMWLSMFGDEVSNSPLRLVQMLCGSLLQHVTFDFCGVPGDFVAEFFALLSSSSSDVRLRSMHLKGRSLWDMAAYLSSTIHLRHFTFTFVQGRRTGDEFAVPLSFLRSLRHNGSVHTVEFKNEHGESYIPSDFAARMIHAYTTRNRKVAESMKSSFHTTVCTDEVNATDTTRDLDAASATRQKEFPALCRASHQAERMAPNSMLQGLLASSDMLDAISNSSSRVLGKRMATEALEDA